MPPDRQPTRDTPEAEDVLAAAMRDLYGPDHDPKFWLDDAEFLLAAMPDWVLMPRVATADWTGSTIDQKVEELERIVHPEGRCAVCDGGKPYWKHTANDEDYHAFVPPARADAVPDAERLRAALRAGVEIVTDLTEWGGNCGGLPQTLQDRADWWRLDVDPALAPKEPRNDR